MKICKTYINQGRNNFNDNFKLRNKIMYINKLQERNEMK